MTKARNLSLLSAVEAGATTDQTKADIDALGINRGRKNLILNGSMQVAQRPTASGINSYGTRLPVDGWVWGSGGDVRATATQSSDVPTGAGFGKSLKLDVTTADSSLVSGDYVQLIQRFEGQNLQLMKKGTSSAESLTLSFWIKTPVTGTYIARLWDNENSSRCIQKPYTVSVANTWEKKTVVFEGDTTGAFSSDNLARMNLTLWFMAGPNYTSGTLTTTWSPWAAANGAVGQVNAVASTSNDIYITGFQLELGSVATDFEHRSFGEELALCQRYYEIIADGGRANDSPYFGVGQGVKSDQINWFYDFKAEKRATFTLIVPTVSNGYSAKTHSTTKTHSTLGFTSVHQSLHSIMGYMTNISGVTEQSCWQMQLNSASAHIAVSAEL